MGERMGHGKICGDRTEFGTDLGGTFQVKSIKSKVERLESQQLKAKGLQPRANKRSYYGSTSTHNKQYSGKRI